LGLKNSDDQGTRFDVRAALYINAALVAEGQALCVEGVTRNASQAKEVSVPFGPLTDTPINTGDAISLKASSRIGTNSDGTKCQGHNNAAGLRLYYDGASRPSALDAQITQGPLDDYFLHLTGGSFTLDTVSPAATNAKQKDSGPVHYSGGNPWVTIGTWQGQVAPQP
jgi:hypothetical protein